MKKLKGNTSVLVIGDKVDYDSYQKFNREKRSFRRYGFEYFAVDYKRFLQGKLPAINTEKIIIFLFFPFSYWNRSIEHKNYKGVYGNSTFYGKFIRFWKRVEKLAKKHFAGKKIIFINDLDLCGACRDKLTVVRKLNQFNISQPKSYKISDAEKILRRLDKGEKFFLKPRYGSMGKGITFLCRSRWQTNFNFKNNKIISRRSDHGWKTREITGNGKFLTQLLKKDILIQEAIDPPIFNKKKIDLRIYTFLGKAIYVYPRKNSRDKVTTNISQGGRGDPGLLKLLPKSLITKAKKEAAKVSKALNINLGGIDVIPDQNLKDVYIIDVNVFSGFPKRRAFNLAKYVAKELRQIKYS